MKHAQILLFRFLTFSVLYLSSFISFAQLSTEEGVVDSTGVKVPAPIKVASIIQRVEEANKNLKLINKKIGVKSAILKIDSLYPEYAKYIRVQEKKKDNFIEANPNREKINNLIKKWNGYHDYLSNWQSVINEHVERNIIVLEVIVFNEETWNLTYQNAVVEKVPLQVLSSIKVIRNDFKKIDNLILKENNTLLILESKINNQKLRVNKVMDELNSLKNSEIYDLFYLRHKPLWKASFESPDHDKEGKSDVESVSENISGIFKFAKTSENSIYLYILIVGFIVFIILFLKKTFEKYRFDDEDGDLQNAKDIILNHYLASIIFLSLVIAKLFFDNAPMLFGNVLILLILILSIPVVQPYMYKRFKKIIYFVILFYILDSAKTFLWFSSSQYRIYLLVEAAMVIGVLILFTRPYLKTRIMKIGRFGLLLIRMTPIIYSLAIISIISNILGYTNLTDVALKISTQSGVFTIIFYGILMIAGGISTGLIHRQFSSQETFDQNRKVALENKLMQIIRVLAFISWFLIFLEMIDLLQPLTEFFTDAFTEPHKFGSITFTIGEVMQFLIILSLSFIFTSLISFLFDSGEVSIKLIKLPKGVPAAISLVIRYFIIAFGIILALSSLGIDLGKFNLMAGALGLGIGFGLQTVISNFVSGLILVFERPIHVGDTVEVNNLLGVVNRIGVRSSSVVTFDGAEVIVPNNNLIANDLINWTLSDSIKRVEILIGTTYGSDPNKILKILTEAAQENEHTLENPSPQSLFSEFGESSLNFKLRFWVHYEVGLQAKSDVSIGIYNRFAEQGIEIPFPQQDIYIKDMPKPGSITTSGSKSTARKETSSGKTPTLKVIKEPLKENLPPDKDDKEGN